jgi:hypothetical protein
MLSGQIADGLTTPLVGFYSDKTDTKCGKRQPWYIFGTILVIPTFLGIFIYPPFENGSAGQIAYYITLPAVFNIGRHLQVNFLRMGQCPNIYHGYCQFTHLQLSVRILLLGRLG